MTITCARVAIIQEVSTGLTFAVHHCVKFLDEVKTGESLITDFNMPVIPNPDNIACKIINPRGDEFNAVLLSRSFMNDA